MKIRQFLILLPSLFAIVSMLGSCTSISSRTPATYSLIKTAPAITTTLVEVTGDAGEKLKIELSQSSGKCTQVWVNGVNKDCDEFGIKLKKTFYCTPPYDGHPANTKIDGEEVYCGEVKFLTEGADIQFKANPASGNRKCKYVGGAVYCY